MFHVKNHKQLNIVDPWAHLGPKRRKLLDSSWAGLFQQHILPQLPVESLRRHYHDCQGRPTKELYAMMGLMVLQQMHDCTDREAVEQFCFKGVSTSLQLFFMTASMAWRPWSQCPDMWSVLFAQPAQQVGEKEALGLLQSGG